MFHGKKQQQHDFFSPFREEGYRVFVPQVKPLSPGEILGISISFFYFLPCPSVSVLFHKAFSIINMYTYSRTHSSNLNFDFQAIAIETYKKKSNVILEALYVYVIIQSL